jgi:hypothetical protein
MKVKKRPPIVPKTPNKLVSTANSDMTPLRLRPKALTVPISLVLSTTTMLMVLITLITTIIKTMLNKKAKITSNMILTFLYH